MQLKVYWQLHESSRKTTWIQFAKDCADILHTSKIHARMGLQNFMSVTYMRLYVYIFDINKHEHLCGLNTVYMRLRLLSPANEVWGKVIFSWASVCPSEVYPSMQWHGGVHLLGNRPLRQTSPWTRIHTSCTDTQRWPLKRAVRVLLECILVFSMSLSTRRARTKVQLPHTFSKKTPLIVYRRDGSASQYIFCDRVD